MKLLKNMSVPNSCQKSRIEGCLKKLLCSFIIASPAMLMAQGWQANYEGVMLQGFYWNSYDATNWKNIESQADELSQYFKLIWIPQSANCGHESMGYDPLYWFSNYNSAFGTEEELRSMIGTLKKNGVGTIADVVINHRGNVSNWVDFPAESYNGTNYQLLSTDICADDDNGKAAEWAKKNGYQLSKNKDTGDDFSGMRDLDHNSQNVQDNVKAYLNFLIKELGYVGVRYDMVKGYAAKFTGTYNASVMPSFSVGEYFDYNKQLVENWIDGTMVNSEIQSAAFDFPTRNSVKQACAYSNWTKLGDGGLATDPKYSRYAVTFVENHDTEKREDSAQDPIKQDTLAANAYILAMPGTPCIFLKHWIDCKKDIKNMILLRNLTGINNQSNWKCIESTVPRYVFTTTGTNGKLLVAVGSSANKYSADKQIWALAAEGKNYRYFIERSKETAWTSLPSGEYPENTQITLRAISQDDNAKIVYTLNGSEPTANSTTVDNETTVSLPEGNHTLKVGLLINGNVSGVIERKYNVALFQPYTISVNVNTDNVGWTNMNVWSWGGDGSHNPTIKNWPGDRVTATTSVGGKQWYTLSYTINSENDYVNFVFSTNTGSPQTENVQNVKKTSYFEISSDANNGKYKVTDVTSKYSSSSISTITGNEIKANNTKVIAIDGTIVRNFNKFVPTDEATIDLKQGLYIVNGTKIAK